MIINQTIKIEGVVTGRLYDQSKLNFFERLYNQVISWFFKNDRERLLKYYKLGPLKWKKESKNVICNSGFLVWGEILTALYGSTGAVTHCALGDDNTAATANDTTLGNEVYRNAIASGTAASNVCYLTAFYSEAEDADTYEEVGLFIDGTGAADSGEMWNHYITGGWTKTLTDALVIDFKFTFTTV